MKPLILTLLLLCTFTNAEDILLTKGGGVFHVPGIINNKVRLEFVVDSGASLVYIPNSVFEQLKKSGTVSDSDILGRGRSQIANGDIVDILIINIKRLKIGQSEIENIKAGVGGEKHSILLGQSALKQFEPWHIDTQKGILHIASKGKRSKAYVSSSQKIGRTEALDFVSHYLSIQNSRDIGGLSSLYASRIDYLGRKGVPEKIVLALKEKEFRQWQRIRIDLIRLIAFREIKSHPGRIELKYSSTYDLYNDFTQKGKNGQMITTLVLEKANGTIRIVSEKVKAGSENRY